MIARLAVAIVNGLVAKRAHARLLDAFVLSRHRVFTRLTGNFTLADAYPLVAVIANSVGGFVVVHGDVDSDQPDGRRKRNFLSARTTPGAVGYNAWLGVSGFMK